MLDTHCHLNDAKYNGMVDQVVSRFLSAGVEKAVCVAWDIPSSYSAKEIAQKYDSVYYAVGVHPDDSDRYNVGKIIELLNAKDKKLVAIGEIGLDYFHNKENKEQQKQVFVSQINLAKQFNLPFIIHCRDAYGDTLEILKQNGPFKSGFVVHCFSGSLEFAKEIIKLGGKISFTGSVTFKNAKNLQEVARNIPEDSFFFETDSPYLTPEPNRGKINEPAYVLDVAKFVADLRVVSANELIENTDVVAKKFFNI